VVHEQNSGFIFEQDRPTERKDSGWALKIIL